MYLYFRNLIHLSNKKFIIKNKLIQEAVIKWCENQSKVSPIPSKFGFLTSVNSMIEFIIQR